MHRLWLLFAQTVTVCLGVLFIVATLRPGWIQLAPTLPVSSVVDTPVAQAPIEQSTVAAVSSYAQAVAQAAPSVVNIYTRKHVNVPLLPSQGDPALDKLFRELPGFSRRKETTSLGSGVIVRHSGYILTNYHVIEAADAIEVALSDGRQGKASLVGADPESDLAVLKIDMTDLTAIRFGDQVLQVGEVVLAIGNPFGVGQTTTMGIVSALGRNRLGINIYENFIQTDAAINPGNSGGALVDTAGQLVGVNTAIYSETGGSMGIGFAIPAAAAHTIMEQIIDTGEVTRGWLGMEPQDLNADLAKAFGLKQQDGVIVAHVLRNGPAWQAGLRVGDIVLKIDNQPVEDAIGFLNQIAPFRPGEVLTLTVVRDGKQRKVSVVAGARPRARTR
ncbi:MAG: trypsin-like peptidase domain-containing protein [Burkholderiaceae bacterium]|nr:trypsin-like peptidase domain-containing protein [Burkholderiaceae bacterium]